MVLTVGLAGCGPSSAERRAAYAERQVAVEAAKQQKAQQAKERKAELDEQLKTTDCGPLPKNWRELVKKAIAAKLKDPNSAMF